MSPVLVVCLISGVVMSAVAQIVLKAAMISPGMQRVLAKTDQLSINAVTLEMMRTPLLYAGVGLYFLSMVVWLYVLSRIDVSLAYPFVGLGIVVTTILGQYVLGEPVTAERWVGCVVVVAGLVLVSRS